MLVSLRAAAERRRRSSKNATMPISSATNVPTAPAIAATSGPVDGVAGVATVFVGGGVVVLVVIIALAVVVGPAIDVIVLNAVVGGRLSQTQLLGTVAQFCK